jgi:hypothetical protein
MIHLAAEVVSGLNEDTFWTWFHREFPASKFSQPRWRLGKNDVVLQYSTLGAPRFRERSVALLWELLPDMKEVFRSDLWDTKIQKTHECARGCRHRVVATPLAVRHYEHHGPVDVLPIGVNTDLFKPLGDKIALRRKYDIPVGQRVGFWCGTTHPMKGFHRLLEWRRDHPDVHWIIVWKQPSEAGRLPGATEFTLVDQQRLAELMNCADFFLSCGMLNPFYMVEWEAMACNLHLEILDGREKDFVPSPNPRDDIFRLKWDRPSAKRLWTEYLESRFPGSTGEVDVPEESTENALPSPRRFFVGSSKPDPRVSIAALIYRSSKMADWLHESLVEFTPMLGTGEAEFFFVANDASDSLLAHLQNRRYRHFVKRNQVWTPAQLAALGFAKPEYIHRVYRGWNEAIGRAEGEIVVLINSDMFVGPRWLENLLKHVSAQQIVCSQLIERKHPKHGVFEGAYHQEFGTSPATFNKQAFLDYCTQSALDRLKPGGAYMPCAVYKRLAIDAGWYPEGNLRGRTFDEVRRYGDVDFFHRLAKRGVRHVTALDSLVYHLKEGEMDE